MKNSYFEIYTNTGKTIEFVQVNSEKDIWYEIANSPEYQTNEMLDKFHESPYNFIYNQDIKKKLLEVYPEFQNLVNINLDNPYICVRNSTQADYRQVNEQFDHELSFLEYIQSTKSSVDKKTLISKELLEKTGFKNITNDLEANYYKDTYGLDDYRSYRIWTDKFDKNPSKVLKLDIDNGLSNSGRLWNLHIDNCDCCTIGCAELDNVWQFNTLMEVFGSKFRIELM